VLFSICLDTQMNNHIVLLMAKLCFRHLAVLLLVVCSFSVNADLSSDLERINERIKNELPMPIGEVITQLEGYLLTSRYSELDKQRIAAKYVELKVKLHQQAPPDVMTILRTLVADTPLGLQIKLGIARMRGINASYDESYALFSELLQNPAISPKLKAESIAYLILTYNEGQVFTSSAKLLNNLNELVHNDELDSLLALNHYMAADYYHSIFSYDIAFEYYEKSLREAKEAKEWVLVSDNLYAIGIMFRNQGDYDTAISYFQQTIENDTKLDINYSEYLALYGMASTYFRADRIDEALAMAQRVTSHPLTSAFYDSEIYRLKAKALLDSNRLDEARVALDQSRKMYDDFRKDEKTTWRAELEKIASQITAKEGDYKTAYQEYEKFHQDYIDAKKFEGLELVESANLIYQIEQQKEKTSQLEKENKAFSELLDAKEAAENSQRLFTRWLIIVVSLALVTLVIILALLKKSKQTNALYVLAKEKAELHNRLKTEFISNISHEIRTPLNAIIGFGQVLAEKLEDKQTKKLTNQIVNSSDMLLQLINDLLDFSKIEAGKLVLDYGPYNVRHSLRKLGDIFYAQAESKGLMLTFKVDPELPKELVYDELRFKQVLANLISNAIKFSNEGAIEIGVRVIEKDASHCQFEVWVQDNGIGISRDQQENLFQPFIQAESSTARKYGGSGLGLNICNKLLELMDSKLQVTSSIGKGARFYFNLDLSCAISAVNTKPHAHEPVTQFKKTNVLLAEDNDINVDVFNAMLSASNLHITRVANGNAAIHKLRQQPFDIVMMDIQMPEMDGYEATWVIRHQMNMDIPIIALTANAMQQDINACIEAGMNEHIGKPIEKTRLLDLLNRYLN